MSSTLPAQNGQSPGLLSYVIPYLTPPIAASAAIVPVFPGFVAKSAQQIGKPIPKMTFKEMLVGGLKVSPTIGFIVGTQMIVQNIAEKALMKNSKNSDEPNFLQMLASSVLVGGISAPALAVFNRQTMGQTVAESLKSLSAREVLAIVSRETSFLFSLRISDPLSQAMKRYSGDNKAVDYSSAFVSGVVGSIIGNPFDAALTLWQKGMKVENFYQLMRGSPIRALSIGGFSVFYKLAKDIIQSQSVFENKKIKD